MSENKFALVQVGITAMRTPMGEFLPAVPIYVLATNIDKKGLSNIEKPPLKDVSGFFIEKHREIKPREKRKGVKKNGI